MKDWRFYTGILMECIAISIIIPNSKILWLNVIALLILLFGVIIFAFHNLNKIEEKYETKNK